MAQGIEDVVSLLDDCEIHIRSGISAMAACDEKMIDYRLRFS